MHSPIKEKLSAKIELINEFQAMSRDAKFDHPTPLISAGGNARKSELKSILKLI